MNKIKALFLAANPEDTSTLKLDEEIRSISEKIRASSHRDMIELTSSWAIRPDDLLQSLNEHKPQIVHFSGHGTANGDLLLLDNNRKAKPASKIALKSLFETLKDNIQIVILNACYSKIQSEAISDTIDCVIGMNSSIGDNAAILFAASFYRAVGFGRSIKEAFEQGKVSLLLEGVLEENIPELICKTKDPSKIFLLKNDDYDSDKKQTEKSFFNIQKYNSKIDTVEDQHTDLILGDPNWIIMSPFSVIECSPTSFEADNRRSTLNDRTENKFHEITFTRLESEALNDRELVLEFDVTNFAKSDLRITGIDIEVLNFHSLPKNFMRYPPAMGIGEKRVFHGLFRSQIGAYPCSFTVPNGYVRLSEGEMEVIKLQVNTPDEGIYELAATIRYSVAGRNGRISTISKKDLWFMNHETFSAAPMWEH